MCARHCRRAPAVFLLLISDPWRPHPREEGEKRQSHDPQAAHARPPGLLIVHALLYARAGAVRRGVGGHGGRASVLSLEPLPLGQAVARASRQSLAFWGVGVGTRRGWRAAGTTRGPGRGAAAVLESCWARREAGKAEHFSPLGIFESPGPGAMGSAFSSADAAAMHQAPGGGVSIFLLCFPRKHIQQW